MVITPQKIGTTINKGIIATSFSGFFIRKVQRGKIDRVRFFHNLRRA